MTFLIKGKKHRNKKKSKVQTRPITKNPQDLFENLNYIDDEELSLSEDLVKQHETPTSVTNQRSNVSFDDVDEDYDDDDNVIYEGNYSDNEIEESHDFINELNKNYEKEKDLKSANNNNNNNDNTSEDGASSDSSDLNLDDAIDDAQSEKRGLLEEESFKCCSEPNTPSGRLSPVSNRPFKFEHNADSLFKSAKNGNLIKNANNNVNSFVYDVNLYNNQNIMLLNFDKDEFDKQLRLKKKQTKMSKQENSCNSSSSSINNNIQHELEPLIIEEESGEDDEAQVKETMGNQVNQTVITNNKIYNYDTTQQEFSSSCSSTSSNQSANLNNTISPSNSTIVKSSSSSSQLANVNSETTDNNQQLISKDGLSTSSSSSSCVSAIVDSIDKNDDVENQRTESLELITDLSKKVSENNSVEGLPQ